jgi:hypothetical protein
MSSRIGCRRKHWSEKQREARPVLWFSAVLTPSRSGEMIQLHLDGGRTLLLNVQPGFNALEASFDGGASHQHRVDVFASRRTSPFRHRLFRGSARGHHQVSWYPQK